MKTDSLFYRLFQTLPTLVLELAGIETPLGAERYTFHAEEVKQTAFRLDGLLLPPVELRDAPVVFVEVQYQPDEEFYGRLFAEMFLYLYRATPRRRWRAVVIYPGRKVERFDERYDSLLTLPEVHRVYLEDWREQATPTLGLALLQLLIVDPATAGQRASDLARRIRDEEAFGTLSKMEWLDLIETILVYRLPQFSREEIQTMLGLTAVDLKNSRFYQEVFAEGMTEGEIKGEIKGELKLLQRQLTRRFGPLPDWAELRLSGAEPAQLERWGERVLDAATLAAVFAEE